MITPKYWRPPYGDADNRIRAIAKEVFGLEVILWNQEYVSLAPSHLFLTGFVFSSGDWNLAAAMNVSQQINYNFRQWLTGKT